VSAARAALATSFTSAGAPRSAVLSAVSISAAKRAAPGNCTMRSAPAI